MVGAWERFEVQLFPSPLPHQLHLAETEEPIQVERGTLCSARLQELCDGPGSTEICWGCCWDVYLAQTHRSRSHCCALF